MISKTKALEQTIDHWKRILMKAIDEVDTKTLRINDLKESTLTEEEKKSLRTTSGCFLCNYVVSDPATEYTCTSCPMYGYWPTIYDGVTAPTCYNDNTSLYSILEEDENMDVNFNTDKPIPKEIHLKYIKTIIDSMEKRLNELTDTDK